MLPALEIEDPATAEIAALTAAYGHVAAGRLNSAKDMFLRAAALARGIQDSQIQATAIVNIGGILRDGPTPVPEAVGILEALGGGGPRRVEAHCRDGRQPRRSSCFSGSFWRRSHSRRPGARRL